MVRIRTISAFIRDEDGVFISLATVTKIRREGPYLRTREENPQTPWIAETRDGEQHRFWVRDDEEGVQRMLATVIPAAPGERLYRFIMRVMARTITRPLQKFTR